MDMTIPLWIVFMHIMQRMHENLIVYHPVISTVHTPQMELCCLAANLRSQCLKFSVFWYAVLCLKSSGSWCCEGSQCRLLGLPDPGDEGAVSCDASAAACTLTLYWQQHCCGDCKCHIPNSLWIPEVI